MQIIAEIGINHNGDLNQAMLLMKMAKECGADLVKFQKRCVDTVYTQAFLDSPRESPWGGTQRAQKEGLEFSIDDYCQIEEYSTHIDLPWFASSWDLVSLDEMESFNPPFHKIASPMLTNLEFVRKVAEYGRKTIISCGGSTWEQVDAVFEIFRAKNVEIVLMHCVSEYPCSDDHVNLGLMCNMQSRYPGAEIGYSNHSPGIESCVGASYLGAKMIECHITLDRSMYGSDQSASLERRGLELVVKYAKNAHKIIGDGIRIIRDAERVNVAKMRYWEGK